MPSEGKYHTSGTRAPMSAAEVPIVLPRNRASLLVVRNFNDAMRSRLTAKIPLEFSGADGRGSFVTRCVSRDEYNLRAHCALLVRVLLKLRLTREDRSPCPRKSVCPTLCFVLFFLFFIC